MRLKDGSKKLYESAVPESESPATKRGRAAGTVEPIGAGPDRPKKKKKKKRMRKKMKETQSRGERTMMRTSTSYARKPRDAGSRSR